jgi:hypothetical protein
MKRIFLFIIVCSAVLPVLSQNYHAIHGSSYAGSLGVMNNPASIVNTEYPWDVNLFSFQVASSTNAVTVLNYSLLSSPANSLYRINKGEFKRYAKENYNFHLINARVALNRTSAIAFGVNFRGYIDVNSSRYNFIDTIKNLRNFLKANESNTNLQAHLQTTNWLEVYGTYSYTLKDDEQGRLNGGLTLKGSRGLAGGFAGLDGIAFSRTIRNNQPFYTINAGNVNYAYSSNIDKWVHGNSFRQNASNLILNSDGSVSMDLGIEYLVKPQMVTNFNDDDNYYDYKWKIGISLLDLGVSKYKYSLQSRTAVNSKVNLADTFLQRKFNRISSIQSFNDTLAALVPGLRRVSGFFTIINPARLVVNVDRHLFDDFYLNGEVSANLSTLVGAGKLYSSEISLLTVTPRWETKRYGLYLPVQFTTEHQFWIGGAFKAGPLLFGLHNLNYIFSRKKMQSGGGYLALVIRPWTKTRNHRDKRLDCPR